MAGSLPNPANVAGNPGALSDAYRAMGMPVPERVAAQASASQASPKVADAPAAQETAPPVSDKKRAENGRFAPKAETAEKPAEAVAPPAASAPAKFKVKVRGVEREASEQEIEAILLERESRPAMEAQFGQRAATLKQQEAYWQQQAQEVDSRARALEARESEVLAYRDLLMEAERKVAAGETPTIADFLQAKQTSHAETPAEKPLTARDFDAMYQKRRQAEIASQTQSQRQARAVQVGDNFDAWVKQAVMGSLLLSKRIVGPGNPRYAQNLGFEVAQSYFNEGVNLADLPDRAIQDRIQARVRELEVEEESYIRERAGEYLDQHQGKQLGLAPTPSGASGTPLPQPQEDEFKLTPEAYRAAGYNFERMIEQRASRMAKHRDEVARFKGH